MKFAFRGVSGAALLLGLSGGLQAWAQQAPTPPAAGPQNQTVSTSQQAPQTPAEPSAVDQTRPAGAQGQDDRVVVTGSLLITAPEDAPKPVESYNYQELRETGAPSVSEFVRDLSINYDSSLYQVRTPASAATTRPTSAALATPPRWSCSMAAA